MKTTKPLHMAFSKIHTAAYPTHTKPTNPTMLQQKSLPDSPQNDHTKISFIDQTRDILASFFGTMPPATPAQDKHTQSSPPLSSPTPLPYPPIQPISTIQKTPTKTKTKPIAFSASSATQPPPHRLHSAPIVSSNTQPAPPDYIDPKDNHIWRSKYCILEDGVLYFYRNADDAQSSQAQAERASLEEPSFADLSKSPQPKQFLADTSLGRQVGEICEKRVALGAIHSVRSAELEYGSFAFELWGTGGKEQTNKLVLRARNEKELNDWIFQFHRCLASFMKNLFDTYKLYALALHHPTQPFTVASPAVMDLPLSPPYRKPIAPVLPLSHGHGRSGMHRRRGIEETATHASELPDLPLGDMSAPIQFSIEKEENPKLTTDPLHSSQLPIGQEKTSLKETNQIFPSESMEEKKSEEIKPIEKPAIYIPPFLRRKLASNMSASNGNGHQMARRTPNEPSNPTISQRPPVSSLSRVNPQPVTRYPAQTTPWQLGGCADPAVIEGSILDYKYKKRSSSKVGKHQVEPFGCYGGGNSKKNGSLKWEVGAVSECGTRETNEDSFLVCTDLATAFGALHDDRKNFKTRGVLHAPGVFGIFDGHGGNEAARYVAESLTSCLCSKWKSTAPEDTADALAKAIAALDDKFCTLCAEDGRTWESGSTAILAVVVEEHLVIANLGDCRAVMSRSTELSSPHGESLRRDGWNTLDSDNTAVELMQTVDGSPDDDEGVTRECFWKEVVDVHSPSRDDEQARIEAANGWITTGKEIPIGQLHRMDFFDKDVMEILERCFSDRYRQSQPTNTSGATLKRYSAAPQRIIQISRVCGELAVSRAIGDRDFKEAYNQKSKIDEDSNEMVWDCPYFFSRPDEHSGKFKGDLVIADPEIRTIKISPDGCLDEFVLLACDGLWDVMDADDAVRVSRNLLYDRQRSAKQAARRLAELAIHLGSSDNITVILIRFFNDKEEAAKKGREE